MLLHTFLFIPNLHQPTTSSHRLFSLSFFHPPLHCTAAIPKYPWSTTIKSHPHLIFHTNIYIYSCLQLRELRKSISKCSVGLDYLHNGSEPRIIHRDVKCSNILLDMEMNAKVCDFGLSKQITQADATHVTTVVKGTAGYLDPDFGVVLLELICGREPLSHSGTPDSFNLVLWAKPYLQAGAFEIVDESLTGTIEVESMRKAAFVAVKSVERDASQRPTIAEVLAELIEAYSIQLSYLASFEHGS